MVKANSKVTFHKLFNMPGPSTLQFSRQKITRPWKTQVKDHSLRLCGYSRFCRASPVSRPQSRAWSFACLGRFTRRTKKKERLLVVYKWSYNTNNISHNNKITGILAHKTKGLLYIICTIPDFFFFAPAPKGLQFTHKKSDSRQEGCNWSSRFGNDWPFN